MLPRGGYQQSMRSPQPIKPGVEAIQNKRHSTPPKLNLPRQSWIGGTPGGLIRLSYKKPPVATGRGRRGATHSKPHACGQPACRLIPTHSGAGQLLSLRKENPARVAPSGPGKREGATGSLAIVAPGRGPSHPRSTATDRDCRRFPVESRKSMFRTLHPVAPSASRKEKAPPPAGRPFSEPGYDPLATTFRTGAKLASERCRLAQCRCSSTGLASVMEA